jgi:carbon-monoxide dehydrogenase large subunit
MLHLSIVRAQTAHAKILDIDSSALADIGFPTQVFTAADIGKLAIKAHQDYPQMQYSEQPVLAMDRMRFVGEPVAAVLADDPYRAEDAAEMVFVDYDPLPVVGTMDQARDASLPTLFDGWKSNVIVEREMKGGDLDKARAEAAHVIRRTYSTQRQAGVSMEGRGVVAEYNPADRVLTVWSSTQFPHIVRTCLAEVLDWPESRLRVVAPDVGGGFGVKGQVYPEEILVPWLAVKTGRPVKWVEDRR